VKAVCRIVRVEAPGTRDVTYAFGEITLRVAMSEDDYRGWVDDMMKSVHFELVTYKPKSPFCYEVAPVVGGDGLPIYCRLTAGHDGKHHGERGDTTCDWDADSLDARRFNERRWGMR
jgi:hypothetical protein